MKKSLLPIFVIAFLLLLTPLYRVYAVDLTTKTATESSSEGKNKPTLKEKLQKVEDHKAVVMDKMQNKIDDLKAKIASRQAEFKNKIAKFKDQEKATIVQRVNDNLEAHNKRKTDGMTLNLNRISDLLEKTQKLASSSATASPSAQTSINDARAAIVKAQNAVASQSAKTYVIQVTTESSVHKDAQTQRDLLVKDLQSVRQLVLDAKQATVKAILAIKGANK